MKVCHLTSVHPRHDIRIFLKECCSLVKAGYDTILIVADGRGDEKIRGTNIIDIGARGNGRIGRMTKSVYGIYRKALEVDAEIYHFHDPELIPAGLLLRRKGKIVIYDAHEDAPRDIFSKSWIKPSLQETISIFIEHMEKYAGKRFNAIVAATPHINERFLNLGCVAVNINNYPLLDELYISANDRKAKKKDVCYIGLIAKNRGMFEMLKAVEETNVRLILCGTFSNDKDREIALSTAGWKNAVPLGQVSRQQVSQIMSSSMAGMVLYHLDPNHINAQPNKMFEYMSAGIPIIASDFPLWKRIVDEFECGLCVDPMNSLEIRKAIQWIVEHPDEAEKMGRNGRRCVEERFNWDMEAKKLLALYQRMR